MNWDRGPQVPSPRAGPGAASPPAGAQSVDVAVLQELRAIREEISKLAEKVGRSATREDLDDYVRQEEFRAHVEGHRRVIDGWRGWLPIALASGAILWNLLGGPHLALVMR